MALCDASGIYCNVRQVARLQFQLKAVKMVAGKDMLFNMLCKRRSAFIVI